MNSANISVVGYFKKSCDNHELISHAYGISLYHALNSGLCFSAENAFFTDKWFRDLKDLLTGLFVNAKRKLVLIFALYAFCGQKNVFENGRKEYNKKKVFELDSPHKYFVSR